MLHPTIATEREHTSLIAIPARGSRNRCRCVDLWKTRVADDSAQTLAPARIAGGQAG